MTHGFVSQPLVIGRKENTPEMEKNMRGVKQGLAKKGLAAPKKNTVVLLHDSLFCDCKVCAHASGRLPRAWFHCRAAAAARSQHSFYSSTLV